MDRQQKEEEEGATSALPSDTTSLSPLPMLNEDTLYALPSSATSVSLMLSGNAIANIHPDVWEYAKENNLVGVLYCLEKICCILPSLNSNVHTEAFTRFVELQQLFMKRQ